MTLSPRGVVEAPAREWRQYPEYQDTGVEWLGNIPAHWQVGRVREHSRLINGYPFDSQFFSHDSGIPLVRIRDITTGATETYYTGTLVPSAMVSSGDLLIGMDGDFNVRWWQGGEALLNQRLCCLRPKETLDKKYLYYLLPFPLQVTNDLTWFTTVKHLSSTQILKFLIALPPLPEQQAISAFLDREIQKIDDLIAKREQLIGLLQEKKTALISRTVTKGLDPDVPMKDSGVEWLGEIPEYWTFIALRRLLARIEQGWSPIAEDREASLGEWGVIKISAISRGLFRPEKTKALPPDVAQDARYEIRAGDILLTRGNTPNLVGDVCVVGNTRPRLMLSDLVYRLSVNHQKVDGAYLMYWLLSRAGRYQITRDARGSSQSMVKISQEHIRSWSVTLPPLAEQQAIVAFVERETSKLDALADKVREHIDKLREYRTALISAAVTGKIDVRDERERMGI